MPVQTYRGMMLQGRLAACPCEVLIAPKDPAAKSRPATGRVRDAAGAREPHCVGSPLASRRSDAVGP